jgi:hypothetical protein
MNDEAQVAPGDDPAVAPSSGRPEKASPKSQQHRLDPAVHEALAKWAADDLRSLNAHIEVLLREALKKAGRDVKAGPLRRPGRPPRE